MPREEPVFPTIVAFASERRSFAFQHALVESGQAADLVNGVQWLEDKKAERHGPLLLFFSGASSTLGEQSQAFRKVDEIGYLPIDRAGANLFFQLATRRYERGPMILTTTKASGRVHSESSAGRMRPALSLSLRR
jgi:hypothetical protein